MVAPTWQMVEGSPLTSPEPELTNVESMAMAQLANVDALQAEPEDPGMTTRAADESAQFLDAQQRYQLLTPLPALSSERQAPEIQVQVLDRQPFQVSPLEVLISQIQRQMPALEMRQPSAFRDYLAQETIPLPETAHPYLALQRQFPHVIPGLHDAWQQHQQDFLLLEDRSDLALLIDCCQDESVLFSQVLSWLDQMLDLWSAFEPWGCCQSLLEISNLRVDQDQVLCLQRLYVPDFGPEQPSEVSDLKDLGTVWQTLLSQSCANRWESFAALLTDLQAGNILTLTELQALLSKVAEPGQASFSVASAQLGSAPTQLLASGDLASAGNGGDVPTAVLPNQLVALESAGQTDTGRDRHHNEDYFVIYNRLTQLENPVGKEVQVRGLYILCDGMGGHAEGEVASTLAASTLKQYFQTHWQDHLPSEASIKEAIYAANQVVYEVNEQKARSGSGRMGTTLVVVLVQGTQVRVAHVGDSRLYRLTRKRELEQVTVDHEVGQREMRQGVSREIAYARMDAYQLTQALGPKDQQSLHPEVQSFEVDEDMLLLLCSDGLTDNDLLETHWLTHLQPLLNSRTDLEQGISQLIDLGNSYNGHDNITAVAIRLQVRPQLKLVF